MKLAEEHGSVTKAVFAACLECGNRWYDLGPARNHCMQGEHRVRVTTTRSAVLTVVGLVPAPILARNDTSPASGVSAVTAAKAAPNPAAPIIVTREHDPHSPVASPRPVPGNTRR